MGIIKEAIFMPFAIAMWMTRETRQGHQAAAKKTKRARLLFWRGVRLLADKKINDIELGPDLEPQDQETPAPSRVTSIEIE